MKAFLSHNKADKEFVKAVADQLGRQYSVFDERSFDTGVEFKRSIEIGLDESSIFVLFASKSALKSLWVDFEISQAWFQTLEKKLRQSLVFILDSSLEPHDLPVWLQRAKISRAVAPNPVARLIRDHLDAIRSPEYKSLFVGRREDVESIQQALTPWDGSEPPKTLIVTGLPCIGRRSLIKHICPFTLNLDRINVIRLENGETLTDLAIKLADLVEPFSTAEGFKIIVESIRRSSENEIIQRIVNNFQLCIANRELPLLFDSGGLLDEDGRFVEFVRQILAALPNAQDCYLFIVSKRKPLQEPPLEIPVISLNALKPKDTKSLISAFAQRKNLKVGPGEISELAEYAGGFPPSCIYAVQLAIEYGLSALLANKRKLVEFRTAPFIKYLAETSLDTNELNILRMLAEYSPLPLSVIGRSLSLSAEEIGLHITKLIDFSLIEPAREGFYAIAEPIVDAVFKATRLLMATNEHLVIAHELKKFLGENGLEEHAIDGYRALYRAARNANDVTLAGEAIHFASDLIHLLERNYHSRNYEQAVKLGKEAISISPKNVSAHDFLIRALIQENMWTEANEALLQFESVGPSHDILFLKGFLHRKKGEFDIAIEFFKKAEKAGRTGASLKRELASCYAIEGMLDEADKYLKQALRSNWDNPFLVDLGVKIATQMDNEKLARERLEQLKLIESAAFYQHRLSHVELRFGRIPEALEAAKAAVEYETKPTLQMLGQLAICEIKTGGLNAAEEIIQQIEKNFPRSRPDFKLTARSLIELDRKHYSNTLTLLEKCTSKKDYLYYQLKNRALKGEIEHSALSDNKRNEYIKEIERLESLLSSKPVKYIDSLLEV